MAIPGSSDSDKTNDGTDAPVDKVPDFGAPMPGEDPSAKPLASSIGQAARSFESKFAARRKKRLEETAAALSSDPSIEQNSAASGYRSAPESGSEAFSASRNEANSASGLAGKFPRSTVDGEIGSNAPIDDNAKRFLAKLSGKMPSDDTLQEAPRESVIQKVTPAPGEVPRSENFEPGSSPEDGHNHPGAAAGAESPAAGAEGWHKVSDSKKMADAANYSAAGNAAPSTGSDDLAKPDPYIAPASPEPSTAPPLDISSTRAGFKPRKDLSSYRNFDSGRAAGSSSLSGPGGSADAKLFGGMGSAPEDLPPEEPQTPEERKKALDALGYKYGTDLPKDMGGIPGVIPTTNDQLRPPVSTPPAPAAAAVAGVGSEVGWQTVPKDETRPKAGAFAAARKSQTLGPVETAAKKKEEADRQAPEKPKPFRGREDESQTPKNRWGQVPDTATARSVWADQLGIAKPTNTMRGPSASLRGRLKRVMSADIFNVRELYSLRGIACFIVFLAQAQIFAGHGKPAYPVNVVGAQIFFVMSGFVITRWLLVNETGSLQRTLGEFYARRALRIFPMYYLVLCVLMATGHLANPESFFCGLFNFSAFQATTKAAPQLLQYWTLCVEMQFYVLFPLLLMVTPQRFRMAIVILLTGATVVCTYLSAQHTPHAQDWLLLPISGQYLMWGCLAGFMDVKSDIALSLNASWCVVLGLVAQAGLHAWLLVYGNVAPADVADLLWKGFSTINAISLAVLIFGLWRTSNAWLRGICANDVLVYFGKISYGFYLLLPLCFFMQPSIIAVMPILLKVPAIVTSFVITFIMAVVTFHYLQSPINNVREHLPIAR